MKLSLAEQRKLIRALPEHRINACRHHCQMKEQSGAGFLDILKSIGSVLGNVGKEIGPTVLKELIIPMIKTKISGNGLRLPGRGTKLPGGAMSLTGKGIKKKKKKKAGAGLRLAGKRR